MTDLLAAASAIAELRDMDRLLAFITELTTWRPVHDGACAHCAEELAALTGRLLTAHQLDPRWTYARLVELRPARLPTD